MLKALQESKCGKAVGSDNIPVEAWKALGVECLTEVFTNIMLKEEMLEEWRNNTLTSIFKNKEYILQL